MGTYTIGQLTKAESESVFVLNTSINVNRHKRSTNVAFEIHYGNQVRSVLIMDSWIPQDLSMQAPKDIILASPSFRDAIRKGLIELVKDEDALKLLHDEDAKIEQTRLRNKYNSATADLDMEPIMPKDIIVAQEAEDPNVSAMIKDLCVRDDIDPVAVYAKLKSSEKALNKDEWKYLDRNLNSACRNEKIDEFIRKH